MSSRGRCPLALERSLASPWGVGTAASHSRHQLRRLRALELSDARRAMGDAARHGARLRQGPIPMLRAARQGRAGRRRDGRRAAPGTPRYPTPSPPRCEAPGGARRARRPAPGRRGATGRPAGRPGSPGGPWRALPAHGRLPRHLRAGAGRPARRRRAPLPCRVCSSRFREDASGAAPGGARAATATRGARRPRAGPGGPPPP